MNLFEPTDCWYWILGVGFSAYQAIRGIIFQHQFANAQKDAQKQNPPGPFAIGAQSKKEILWLRVIPDGLLYFLSTFAGFVSLMLAYQIIAPLSSLGCISGGATGLFIFLALFGLLGVTGQLPHLLQQGKFPR